MIDAVVVGSGPNGLAAAVTLARAGLEVSLFEQASTIGGGLRTAELTLPGFRHDVCSAVHPAALASPFFRAWGLTERVSFIIPDVSYAHPLDNRRVGVAYRDLDRTVAELASDGSAWRSLFEPLVNEIDALTDFTGSQLLRVPPHPITALRYGLRALEQGSAAWNLRFEGDVAPALLSGVAAHVIGAPRSVSTAGAGLLLAAHGHAAGWGFPVGGSQSIADALAQDFVSHGGRIVLNHEVRRRGDLPPARVTLLDTSVELLEELAGEELPPGYRRELGLFRHGAGIAKVDFALSGVVPWAHPSVREAPTVHVGGSREEIRVSEQAVQRGRLPERPYVLVTQPSIFDSTRAPEGQHVLWAYTHVPRNSSADLTETIIAQIERFAPGFRDLILASASMSAREVEANNPNDIGGDIMGGAVSLSQLIRRPTLSPHPWEVPVRGVYLCSASTPPGPAVHGMNGWFAARRALGREFGIRVGLEDLAGP